MAAARHALEHFYYGQLVRNAAPAGDMRLLASSEGISQEEVPELVRAALLPPFTASPLGSWGIVRLKNGGFVFVQSQMSDAGAAMLHIVPMPTETLRPLGGNIQQLMTLLQKAMPVYDRLGDRLPRLELAQVAPPDPDRQTDAMLGLMSCTQNRLDVVEKLLAAIIQGVQLVVCNAPSDPVQRATLVEGLLALLPPPARFGVTFAMHTLTMTQVDAQIRFATGYVPTGAATVFNWQDASVSGTPVEDEYSKFIVSQLRLDTEIVIQQTVALTPVAAWRIKRGDTLAQALAYASYRMSVDNALVNKLPVPVEDALRILAEDPTLSEPLRAAYARHILAFALALEKMEITEPIAVMVRQQPEVEVAVLQQMTLALQQGKAGLIYKTVLQWLQNPLGPIGMDWVALLQTAALAHLRTLANAGDVQGLREFLEGLHEVPTVSDLVTVVPKMIEMALPVADRDPALAQTFFVLAARYLPAEQFQRVLVQPALLQKLPENMAVLVAYLSGDRPENAPPEFLARTVAAFGEDWAPVLLIRLTELALLGRRYDLLDSVALGGLSRAALTSFAEQYDSVFRWVVRTLSVDQLLPKLDEAAPRCLLQILVARRAYPELAHELLRHARVLYPGERQQDFANMVRRLFQETPLSVEHIHDALRMLDAGGVKPLPMAMAHLGALKRNNWPDSMHDVATSLTSIFFNNRSIVEAIPPASLLELLEFHVRRQDLGESLRVAGLFPVLAAKKGEAGAQLVAQMYRMLDWDKAARTAAVEVLRRYIRRVEGDYALQAVLFLTRELGERLEPILLASFAVREMMDGEEIAAYALLLNMAMSFLRDTTAVYMGGRNYPGIKQLFGDLDSLVGGLPDDDREKLAEMILELGRTISVLAREEKHNRPRDIQEHITNLLDAKARPRSALDVFRVLGGYFSRGRRIPMPLEQAGGLTGIHPFRDRAAPSLLLEVQVALRVLKNLLKAFPPEHDITLAPEVLQAELESLWGDLPLAERRKLVRDLATDLQNIPDIVVRIWESGDARALEENSGLGRKLDSNKQAPTSTLEFYRFVHGYFKMRAKQR